MGSGLCTFSARQCIHSVSHPWSLQSQHEHAKCTMETTILIPLAQQRCAYAHDTLCSYSVLWGAEHANSSMWHRVLSVILRLGGACSSMPFWSWYRVGGHRSN